MFAYWVPQILINIGLLESVDFGPGNTGLSFGGNEWNFTKITHKSIFQNKCNFGCVFWTEIGSKVQCF